MLFTLLFAFLGLVSCAFSRTVTYNWDITWVNASPDGFPRPVIGINNQFPCPPINVNIGDRLIVNVNNKLGNESTSIHFHGLFQTGTNSMDGPVGVTQCPILPGQSFQYDFVVNQPGTYWYHSHDRGQYIDGLRGAFIVHDPNAPFHYDEDLYITTSDWYHEQAPKLINYFQSTTNEVDGGSEPIPDSALLLDTQNAKINVKCGKTYLLRIINIGSFVGSYLSIPGHQMTIVEVDGVYTEPQIVNTLYLTVAQRYSVLITTKNDKSQNFAILNTLDTAMFDHVPPGAQPDVYGYLIYDDKKPLPSVSPLRDFSGVYDDFQLIPKDRQKAYPQVDKQIIMSMNFSNDQGVNRATINNVTYVPQKVPTLFTALSAPKENVMDPRIYGNNSNSWVLESNDIIEIVLINNDGGAHPWHLHGHNFQVIARSPSDTPYKASAIHPPHTPIRRDTIQVHDGGYLVIRFKADNPGIQLFHCHIEWHVEAGLVTTLVEAPDQLQQTQTVSHAQYKTCEDQGIQTKGNAAGNTKNWLDLTGQNTQFDTNPWGALINPPGKLRRSAKFMNE